MPLSTVRSAPRALTDAALALLVACVAGAQFLPPFAADTLASPGRTLAAGAAAALATLAHWVLLAVAARRQGRAFGGWLGLSVLLFPVGSVAALLLLLAGLHPPAGGGHAPAAR